MSKRCLLVIVISFVFLLPFSAESANVFAPPMPARIGGSVTVDGTSLTQATDDGYTFTVTKQDGSDYVDLNGDPAHDTDGLNASDLYLIDIPIYDAADQTDGANPGDTAVIHVFKDGSELTVTSPSNGEFAVSDSGTNTQIDLVANTDTNLKPVANAGPDDTVNESSFVSLDGSGSSDPDGTVDIYSWSQTAGTQVVLSNTAAQKPTFTAPSVGAGSDALTFQLIVTDNDGAVSDPDEVTIIVSGSSDHDTLEIESGTLNGTSLSSSSPSITVNKGDIISGSVYIKVRNIHGSNAIFPVGWSWSWASDNKSGYSQIDSWADTGNSYYTVSINKTAPSTSGTYYITFGCGATYGIGNLFASKCGSSDPTSSDWNNGNDIADLGSSAYSTSNSQHWVSINADGGCTFEPGIAMIKVVVNKSGSSSGVEAVAAVAALLLLE